MNYGFIYCLGNDAMPGIYKIGMTERAPSQRVMELSGSTSAAMPFELLCFGEVEDPRSTEASIHAHFAARRVNPGREFFTGCYSDFAEIIKEYVSTFAETDEGAIHAHKDSLFLNFIHAENQQNRITSLIEAAAFEGKKLWLEGDTIHSSRPICRYTWLGAAIYALQDQLIKQLPKSKPESHVGRLLAKAEGEQA